MYYISSDRERIEPYRVQELLRQSYWAKDRSLETICTSLEHSLLYGVFDKKTHQQVAFARVVTDYSTTWYLCDVIVDASHRGHGIGKMLIEHITSDPVIKDISGMLRTLDAHGLYEQYGFESVEKIYMGRKGKSEF